MSLHVQYMNTDRVKDSYRPVAHSVSVLAKQPVASVKCSLFKLLLTVYSGRLFIISVHIHRLTREGVETNLAQAYMAKRRSGRPNELPLTHSLQKMQRNVSNVYSVISPASFCQGSPNNWTNYVQKGPQNKGQD